jgi:hypothetical protein
MALDATPGGQNSNAYVTMAEATTLLQERLATEVWYTETTASGMTLPARRDAALIWATRLLDTQIAWYGTPTTPLQALAWPQTGQVDRYGRPLDPLLIPRDVQMATALTALQLMASEAVLSATGGGELGIKSKRIGDMEIVYQNAPTAAQAQARPTAGVPAEVLSMLRHYGMVPGLGMIPVLRT